MANANFVERRIAQRFKLARPVQLKDGTGMTRDISTVGIFFETKKAHSVGDVIDLSVNFADSSVECAGRVVRVENLDGKFGIAVEVTSYSFH